MASVGLRVRLMEVPMKSLFALLLLLVLPFSMASAQQPSRRGEATNQITANRSTGYNPRAPEGLFDLITYVDGEAIVYIKDSRIHYLLLSGAPLQDSGSN